MSSISAATRTSSAKHFKLHVTLEGPDNYEQWTKALQGQLFSLIRNNDMDTLTSAATLDEEHFKKLFPSQYKEASKDDDNNKQHPFEDDEFLQACLDEALTSGLGFRDWVYDVDTIVRSSLSEDISSRLSAPMGDFVGMLQQVKLAVGHIETSDPTDLEHKYSNCTMEACQNDFMEFTATLAMYLRRLKAADEEVPDMKKQRTLLRGLHPDVFESFIEFAEDKDWDDYDQLLTSTIKKAATPKILSKLNALRPGTHSVFATRATSRASRASARQIQQTDGERRMKRVEAILATMAERPKRAQARCYNGRDCKKQNCRFEHPGPRADAERNWRGNDRNHTTEHGNGPRRGDRRRYRGIDSGGDDERTTKRRRTDPTEPRDGGNKFCAFHRTRGHSTEECHVVASTPDLRRLYLDSNKAQSINAMRARADSNPLHDERDDFCMVTRTHTMPHHVMVTATQPEPLDMTCVDSAATANATWDRGSCTDIVECNVGIKSADDSAHFVCKEKGTKTLMAFDNDTGRVRKITMSDVLISPKFPFTSSPKSSYLIGTALRAKRRTRGHFSTRATGPCFTPRRGCCAPASPATSTASCTSSTNTSRPCLSM